MRSGWTQWRSSRPAGRRPDAPQARVGEAREARRELQAEQVEEREDDVAVAGGVRAVGVDRQLAAVVQDAVKDVRGVADGRADHAGREVRVLIGHEAVVCEAAITTEVPGQRAGLLAGGADEASFAVAA